MYSARVIIERPSDISSPWLERVLAAPPESLRSFSVETVGEGAGILAKIVRVSLDWAVPSALPASVVVKLALDDPVIRSRLPYRLAMGREVRFYRELAAGSGVRTPRIYSAEFDPATAATAFVMEDLGGGMIYETGTAPVEAVLAVSRAIAPLHARWWNDHRLATMDWLVSSDTMKLYAATAREALPRTRLWYDEHAPEVLELAELQLEAVERGVDLIPKLPPTLIHGDLGLKNVAFLDGEPVIFDWQLAGRNSAVLELHEMVKDSYGAEGPRPLAEALLRAHCEHLQAAGVPGMSYERLREDFGLSLTRTLTRPLVLLSVGNPDPARIWLALRWIEMARAFMDEFEFGPRLRRALARA